MKRATGKGVERVDVLVVGAGPAGSLSAFLLARAGFDVLLVERARFPRDKVCGACLHPRGVGVLDEVGLGGLVDDLGAVALGTGRISARGRTAELALPAGARALSRTAFDSALARAAEQAGARVEFGALATALPFSPGAPRRAVALREVGAGARGGDGLPRRIEARLVLAADGLGGAFLAGAQSEPRQRVSAHARRVGLFLRLSGDRSSLEPGVVALAVASSGYAGLVRLEDGSLDLAAAVRPDDLARLGPAASLERIFSEAGAKAPAGLGSSGDPRVLGTPALDQTLGPLTLERAWSLGDAAGYVEPFTGEGMAWALAGARAAAQWAVSVLAEEDRARGRWPAHAETHWRQLHRRTLARRQRACARVAALVRRPRWLALGLCAMTAWPALGAGLLRLGYGARVGAAR